MKINEIMCYTNNKQKRVIIITTIFYNIHNIYMNIYAIPKHSLLVHPNISVSYTLVYNYCKFEQSQFALEMHHHHHSSISVCERERLFEYNMFISNIIKWTSSIHVLHIYHIYHIHTATYHLIKILNMKTLHHFEFVLLMFWTDRGRGNYNV